MERKELKTIAHNISERIEPTFLADKITERRTPLRRGSAPLAGVLVQDHCTILGILLAELTSRFCPSFFFCFLYVCILSSSLF